MRKFDCRNYSGCLDRYAKQNENFSCDKCPQYASKGISFEVAVDEYESNLALLACVFRKGSIGRRGYKH